MGSWNATCGVTQLPLTEGTPVVAFVVVVKQQDFMARDALAGSASVENNLIAQPLSLPIYGTYNDYGGVNIERGDIGYKMLTEMLKERAALGSLLKEKSARPEVIKKLPQAYWEDLCCGKLLLQVKNIRKLWLQDLKKTIAEAEDPRGFEHYAAQLKDDPNLLPDTLNFGLGLMMVHRELFDRLANQVGLADSYGYYDQKAEKLVTFPGNRADELRHLISATDEQRAKIKKVAEEFRADENELLQGMADHLPLVLAAQAARIQKEVLFFTDCGDAAICASIRDQDIAKRERWVGLMLFQSAMTYLRKQWTVQAGGGDSSGLGDFRDIFEVTNQFVSEVLADKTL